MLLLAFQLLHPFHTNDNQWQHNKMATMIVIFIAMITELITVLLIPFVHFLLRCRGRVLADPDILNCSFFLLPPSLSLPSSLSPSGILRTQGPNTSSPCHPLFCCCFSYFNTYFPLLLLKMIYVQAALLHNHICWTPQNLLGTVCETGHHLSYMFPKLIPGKSRILSDSLPTLYHLG